MSLIEGMTPSVVLSSSWELGRRGRWLITYIEKVKRWDIKSGPV
jgi:hypothetical protein